MLDKGFVAEARAKTLQQEREEVCAALQCAASFHCVVEERKDCDELKPKPKEKWIFVDQQKEETKHRTEWCAEVEKHRCMRVWKRQQVHEDARKIHKSKILVNICLERWERRHLGRTRYGKKNGQAREVLIWCRKCSGNASWKNCCKPQNMGTTECSKMLTNGSRSLRMAGFRPRRRGAGSLKDKKDESQTSKTPEGRTATFRV